MSSIARTGEVVWYVTGRFFAVGSQLQDVGYFLHLQGIGEPLFDGKRSESTALLTFSAAPFSSPDLANGSITIGLDARGSFSIFLRDRGGASFDDPASFAGGRCIGTFERVAIVPTTKIAVSATETMLSNVFTARLVSSVPFELGGSRYDLRDLIGYGVTQWGTAAEDSPAGGVPFVGSAIRVST
jgi:hypothetical protein